MANVSKNIKRLRAERKLTQEQLAEALHVTRQTVSSWENDRTQPDIDMLTALASALQTDIEDLIYGKRRHVGLEAEQGPNRKTLSLVLTVFGVLLTAVGLVFVFVYFWNLAPGVTRTALSLLPLLVGAGAGLFVLFTKKQSVFAREGAAVLWFTGVIATNALINGLFYVDLGFRNLLTADLLLLLPVPFLFGSVFGFTAETVLSVLLAVQLLEYDDMWLLFAVPVFISCLVFVYKNKQPAPVKQYCAWLGLLGAGAHITVLAAVLTGTDGLLFFTVPYAFFLALYVAGSTKKIALPLKIPALCALCAATYAVGLTLFFGENFSDTPVADLIGEGVCALLFLIPAAILGRGSYKKNPLRAVFTALFGVTFVLLCVLGAAQDLVEALFNEAPLEVVGLLLSASVGVLVVIGGVKIGRILPANLGMLMLAGDLFIVLIRITDAQFIWIGLTLLFIGVVFLLANKRMVKKFRLQKDAALPDTAEPAEPAQTPEKETEVTEDENA